MNRNLESLSSQGNADWFEQLEGEARYAQKPTRVLFSVDGKPITRDYIRSLYRKVEKIRTYRQVIRVQQRAIDDRNRQIANLKADNERLLNKYACGEVSETIIDFTDEIGS